jgi:hypothetical protein
MNIVIITRPRNKKARLQHDTIYVKDFLMTEAGNMWRRFTLACAKACKSKTADLDVGEIVQRLQKCAAQVKVVYSVLNSWNC